MTLILTFLGKGGVGRTTLAVAAAKQLANQGQRVLLAGQDSGPVLGMMVGTPLTTTPQAIAANFTAVQLQASALLEASWEQLKSLESQYLRTPFFKEVFGQELGVLPGMEGALALNALREYDASGQYDVIVYDGQGNPAELRMWGMPDILSWYLRRFRDVLSASDLAKTLSPFVQPVTSAILNVSWSGEAWNQPTEEMTGVLEKGKQAIADPNRVAAYLVTTPNELAIANAKYLWGAAQQVGLTVGGVLLNQILLNQSEPSVHATIAPLFAPLPVSAIPIVAAIDDWSSLTTALPDLTHLNHAPRPITVNVLERKVSLFLPGFDKKQVKLTQYGPELTIEAGDQRRNIVLPPGLQGQPVTGAKFQDQYLIISF